MSIAEIKKYQVYCSSCNESSIFFELPSFFEPKDHLPKGWRFKRFPMSFSNPEGWMGKDAFLCPDCTEEDFKKKY